MTTAEGIGSEGGDLKIDKEYCRKWYIYIYIIYLQNPIRTSSKFRYSMEYGVVGFTVF